MSKNTPTPRPGIDTIMLAEIEKQHALAQQAIKASRDAMHNAIDLSLVVATLCAKAQRHHRSNIYKYLSPVMDGVEGRAYMATFTASKNRCIKSDKRVLQLLKILTPAPKINATVKTKAKPSLSSLITKATATINKSLETRPVKDMTSRDREQLKAIMRPLAVLYVELDRK